MQMEFKCLTLSLVKGENLMLSYMVAVIHGNYSFNLKQTGYFFSVVETFHLLFSLTIEIYSGKM